MNQFRNVLDRDDPFVSGNVLHQRLHEGCFSTPGFSGYHDVLSVPDSLSQEFNSFFRSFFVFLKVFVNF